MGGQFPPYGELAIRGTRATELPCRILVYVSYIFLPVTMKGWWAVPTLQEVFVRYSSWDGIGLLRDCSPACFAHSQSDSGLHKNILTSNHGEEPQDDCGEAPPLMAGRK